MKRNKTLKHSILLVQGARRNEWEELETFLGERKNYITHMVGTAREALNSIKNENIHIIIADYELPQDKLKFLKKIKGLQPHIEVIFLSEQVSLSKAIEAMKEGAYDFYEFPVNVQLLMAVIEKAIEKQNLFFEKEALEQKITERFDFSRIIGRSKAFVSILDIVRSVALKNVSILITGETGTGKELIANAIHYNSPRSMKPFIKVNCAALSEGILESELFGHEKGSFTGALSKRIGRFELADGGTIFLDEIGDVSPNIQIKLLRVLQEKEFERVGGNETKKVDVRIIAASNKDLRKLVDQENFREDLFYRLNIVNIPIPPLRERTEDIPLLVSHLINKLNSEKDYQIKGISKEAMQILMNYNWPGNIRELENALESAMALTQGDVVDTKYLPAFLLLNPVEQNGFYQISKDLTLHEIEQQIIELTLQRTAGNKTQAAKMLGIGLRTLQRKVQ